MILGAQAGFLSLLSVGPLVSVPMSETFSRRAVFMDLLDDLRHPPDSHGS
jgi:hypothetical protein